MPAPFNWTHEVAQRICDELSGGVSIREIAATDWAPSEPTIYRRMASDQEFANRVALARIAQQDFEADKCVTMADAATPEDWQVVKLQIWARQWRAAKLAPKKYGDKVDVTTDGESLNLTAEDRAAKLAAIQAAAARRKADQEDGTDLL
jgi:hypothetical protein